MPRRDNFDVARVLLSKAIEDEVLVRIVVENPEIGDASIAVRQVTWGRLRA
jgi:hypothetical protein